jgi:hypothetical protein
MVGPPLCDAEADLGRGFNKSINSSLYNSMKETETFASKFSSSSFLEARLLNRLEIARGTIP